MRWQTKKLGEVCDTYQPKTISAKQMIADGKYVVFGANGIIGRYDKYNHEEPQLLITCRGATCGSVNISTPKSWITGNAMVIRPKNETLDLKFLEYIFRGGVDVKKVITGTAQPQITRTSLEPVEITYPESLAEQKRIVKILDEVFEKVTKAKENAEKNLQNAKELFESYLQSVFENPGKDWEEKRLKDICEELFAGGDVPKKNSSKVKTDKYNVPIYANGVKNKGLYGYTNIKRVIKPSVTISARGTIGYSEIRNEAYFPVVRLIVLVPNPKIVDVHYLYYITRSFSFSNTGTSIPQLTIPMVENLKIALPSLKEQKIIVEKLKMLSAETEKLGKIYEQKLADLEELKKSMLKKAFSGEL